VLYRAAGYAEALEVLKWTADHHQDSLQDFDLVFLAMTHLLLGHKLEVRSFLGRAIQWNPTQQHALESLSSEIKRYCIEAEALIARTANELPTNVFDKE
jgi:hypothetical protein